MSFAVTFKQETKTYEKPVSVLEVIGNNREYLCAYVNNRVRELTYLINKDSEVTPLTVKDRDAKPTYEASLRFLVAMAMRNIHPEIEIRFFIQCFSFHFHANSQSRCDQHEPNGQRTHC